MQKRKAYQSWEILNVYQPYFRVPQTMSNHLLYFQSECGYNYFGPAVKDGELYLKYGNPNVYFYSFDYISDAFPYFQNFKGSSTSKNKFNIPDFSKRNVNHARRPPALSLPNYRVLWFQCDGFRMRFKHCRVIGMAISNLTFNSLLHRKPQKLMVPRDIEENWQRPKVSEGW